jgi:predicted ester cyclase
MVGEITQDYHLTIEDIISEGDKVAVRWSSKFIDATTTKLVSNKGVVIYRLADGKIVESWFSTDMLGFMRQLGVLPSPEA